MLLVSLKQFVLHMRHTELTNSGHGSETKFNQNVRRKERLMRKAMVAYLGTASEFTGKFYCHTLKERFLTVWLRT